MKIFKFCATAMKQLSPKVESSNNQPHPFDEESLLETSMIRVCIHRSPLEDSRDVNNGIALNTIQKAIILCLHIAHPTPLQFWQSIFLKYMAVHRGAIDMISNPFP